MVTEEMERAVLRNVHTARDAIRAVAPLIQAQVAEEIAAALDERAAAWDTPQPVPDGWDSHHLIVRNASQIATEAAAKIARGFVGVK